MPYHPGYFNQMQHGIREEHEIHSRTSDHFIELCQKHFQSFSQFLTVGHRFVYLGKFHIGIFTFFTSRFRSISAMRRFKKMRKRNRILNEAVSSYLIKSTKTGLGSVLVRNSGPKCSSTTLRSSSLNQVLSSSTVNLSEKTLVHSCFHRTIMQPSDSITVESVPIYKKNIKLYTGCIKNVYRVFHFLHNGRDT